MDIDAQVVINKLASKIAILESSNAILEAQLEQLKKDSEVKND